MEKNNELIHVKALEQYLAHSGTPVKGRWGGEREVVTFPNTQINERILSLKYRQKC